MKKKQSKDSQLKQQRKRIDQADRELLRALSKRFAAVQKLGALKISLDLPLYQRARWQEVVTDRVRAGRKLGLSEGFIRSVCGLIHREALGIQKDLKAQLRRKKKISTKKTRGRQ